MTQENVKRFEEIIQFIVNNGGRGIEEKWDKMYTNFTVIFKNYNGKVCVFADDYVQIGGPVLLDLPEFASHHIFNSEISPLSKIEVSYCADDKYPHISIYAEAEDTPCCRLYYDDETKNYCGLADDRVEKIYNILKNLYD